jgi:hypothetical protein
MLGASADGSEDACMIGSGVVGTTSHVSSARAVPASADRSSATAAATEALNIRWVMP